MLRIVAFVIGIIWRLSVGSWVTSAATMICAFSSTIA